MLLLCLTCRRGLTEENKSFDLGVKLDVIFQEDIIDRDYAFILPGIIASTSYGAAAAKDIWNVVW
jgi:hypothetical protein